MVLSYLLFNVNILFRPTAALREVLRCQCPMSTSGSIMREVRRLRWQIPCRHSRQYSASRTRTRCLVAAQPMSAPDSTEQLRILIARVSTGRCILDA
eukprot:2779815-Rhodomonas_salina.4